MNFRYHKDIIPCKNKEFGLNAIYVAYDLTMTPYIRTI